MKRLFDIVLSLTGILVTLPFFLIISIIIVAREGFPVLYGGKRVGKNGRIFRMFKFRTMVKDADKVKTYSTAGDDPRLTSIGVFLRRYKLDELPQLFNVFTGDMSFVGPRPEVQHFTDMFTEEEKAILSVRPGITDWASLWNNDEAAALAGSPDPDRTYMEEIRPEKIRLQLKYVRERSFWIDLKILFETFRLMIFRNKSSAEQHHPIGSGAAGLGGCSANK